MSYAPSFIEPDMSNYYRLLRERLRRDQLAAAHPGYTDKLNELYLNNPAISSFVQAIPTADLGPEADPHTVQPGVVPRGIKISNSIVERKIFLKRIFEAAMTGEDAKSDQELATSQLSEYCTELGIEQGLADAAVSQVTNEAAKMTRKSGLTVIAGGRKP